MMEWYVNDFLSRNGLSQFLGTARHRKIQSPAVPGLRELVQLERRTDRLDGCSIEVAPTPREDGSWITTFTTPLSRSWLLPA
jgi:hypothetical protein